MPKGIGLMRGAAFGTELIYVFVIIVSSLMIYFGTKELYELSNHKGIKYFRRAFLFFALAFFFRSILQFVIITFPSLELIISLRNLFPLLNPLTMFLFIYLSSMAIFYLVYSALYKIIDKRTNNIYLFHLVALTIAIVSVWFRNPLIYLGLNLFLFLFVLLITLYAHIHSRNKKNQLFTIYVLLLFFWTLNIIDILIPNIFRTFQILIYLSSITLFLTILYKVLKKSGGS